MKSHNTLIKGMTSYDNDNLYHIVRLHYSADDDKNIKWVKNVKPSYPYEELWMQEMELDFISTAGRRVYPEFTIDKNVGELKYNYQRRVWRGWDFGYRFPACVWAQRTEQGQLHVLAELLGEDTVVDKFANEVKKVSNKLFPGAIFYDAGDPACRQRNDKSERTTADILRQMGIRIQSRPTLIKDGITLIRRMLLPNVDGFVKFKINTSCAELIDGFLGGYVRDDYDLPVENNIYSHIMDALRYLVVILFDVRTGEVSRPKGIFVRERPTMEVLTGY